MPNLTLVITDDLKRKMESHPKIKWSNVFIAIIEQKISDFEETERLAKKSKLAWKHWKPIKKKISKSMAKHARELLNESNS